MELSWTAERAADDVVLVRCRLHNDADISRRARLRSLLDGPVLPPRRRGVPVAAFDANGVDVRLAPGERRAVGFAVVVSPGDGGEDGNRADDGADGNDGEIPADPLVELVDVAAADELESSEPASAAGAVRDLGPYRPPRDAVGDVSADADADASTLPPDAPESDSTAAAGDFGDSSRSPVGPSRVDGWLDAVERRVERGERLSGADVETATEVLAAAGGAAALVDLDDRLAADAERLRRVADRATALADRAAAADPPTDALERLQ